MFMANYLTSIRFSVRLSLIFGYSLISACTTTPSVDEQDPFITTIINYESTLGENHPDSFENVFFLPESLRAQIRRDFTGKNKHSNASALAYWLMSPDGHNLEYQLEANLMPADAYDQRRGNCLTFTLLMLELAEELGIKMEVNQVDVPDPWGQDDENDLVLYRHVNAIFKSPRNTQIFDLALEDYRVGFPQRLISKRQATALLFSNIGIEHLKSDDAASALHYLRLSASIFPKNPDMWINLGAAYKYIGSYDQAEKVYLQALIGRDKNGLAASNLERLYRQQGKTTLADRFEKKAASARNKNPYIHFRKAQNLLDEKSFALAAKSIKRAIKLHDQDPEFYELSGRIKLARNKYIAALEDLETAHNLSQTAEERGRYAGKVRRVVAKVKAIQLQREEQSQRNDRTRNLNVRSYSGVDYTQ